MSDKEGSVEIEFDNGDIFTINLSFCIDKKPMISFIHNPIKRILIFGNNEISFNLLLQG